MLQISRYSKATQVHNAYCEWLLLGCPHDNYLYTSTKGVKYSVRRDFIEIETDYTIERAGIPSIEYLEPLKVAIC